MSHRVQVVTGKRNVALPDGNMYNSGDIVTLTDLQFAKISSTSFGTVLTDLGAIGDPVLEAAYVNVTGDTMTGDLAMGGHKITGLPDPAAAQDAATRAYVLAQITALINGAPGTLDTLGEIATILASDESTAAALATAVAGKIATATLSAAGGASLVGFTPTGDVAATNLQAAIAELSSEKLAATLAAATYLANFDSTWSLALDSGLADGAFGTMVLGRLGTDLYLFGSNYQEPVGALVGVWRYRAGVWMHLGTPTGPGRDYNRILECGAVAYNGELYVGDRRAGALYKLVLNGDGSYNSMAVVAQVGAEDVFPACVVWGLLVCGTYGNPNIVTGGLNPEVWTWDGTEARRILETGVGANGEICSIVPHAGLLWVSATGPNGAEMWTLDQYGTATKVYTGAIPYALAVWDGDLVGCRRSADGSSVVPRMVVWRDGWVDLSGDFAAAGRFCGLLPLGEDLLAPHYYGGVYLVRDGEIDPYGLGSYASTNRGGPMCMMMHDGYLWATTSQPPRLYRLKLGADRLGRRTSRAQQSHGGSAAAAVVTAQVAFTPGTVAGLRLWLNAEDLGNAGTLIATWPDRAPGAAHPATQATVLAQPSVASASGKKVARFGGAHELDTAALDLTKSRAVTVYAVLGTTVNAVQLLVEFAVANYAVDPRGGWLLYTDLVGGHSLFGNSLYGDVDYAQSTNNRVLTAALQMCTATMDTGMAAVSAGGPGESRNWVNESTVRTLGVDGNNANYFGNFPLHIGARLGVQVPFTGDLRHLLIYDGNHDARTRQRIETWLAADSGFTLV